METYSGEPTTAVHEILGLTEDMVEEYNGFIEYLTSDDFTLWLVDLIGRRKVHVGHITSDLFKDGFISPNQNGDKRLPPELYQFLLARVNELIGEGLLRRTNGSVNLLHLRDKPTQPPVYHPKKVREHDTSPETLEQRINAAHIAAQGIHSHSVNGRMR